MSSPGSGTPKPEFSDSDQQWFAALSGKEAGDPASPTVREGLALRAALELRKQEVAADPDLSAATSDEAMQQQLLRLRLRIEAEGVFAQSPSAASSHSDDPRSTSESKSSNVIAFPWWRRRLSLVGMAASLVMAVVVVQMIAHQPDYPPPNEIRGADGVQQAYEVRPREAAEQLATQLRQAGLRPGLYQRGKTYIVDITLMASDLSAAETAFTTLRLKPAAGFNRVEISAPQR